MSESNAMLWQLTEWIQSGHEELRLLVSGRWVWICCPFVDGRRRVILAIKQNTAGLPRVSSAREKSKNICIKIDSIDAAYASSPQ